MKARVCPWIVALVLMTAGASRAAADPPPLAAAATPEPPALKAVRALVLYHVPEGFLVALSVVVLGLTAERFWTLFLAADAIRQADLLQRVKRLVRQGPLAPQARAELLDACRAAPGPCGHAFEQAARYAGNPVADIQTACREQLEIDQRRVGVTTAHLATAARLSPFVGLLGTVLGVQLVFAEATRRVAGREPLLAQGISTALTTTAAGIVVALVAACAAHLARQRQHRLFDEINVVLSTFIPVASAGAAAPPPAAAAAANGRAAGAVRP